MALSDTYVQDVELNKGATFRMSLTSWSIDDVPVDLSGATAKVQFKRYADGAALLELTPGSGLTLATGSIDMEVTPAQSQELGAAGVYDLKVTFTDGQVRRLVKGKYVVNS